MGITEAVEQTIENCPEEYTLHRMGLDEGAAGEELGGGDIGDESISISKLEGDHPLERLLIDLDIENESDARFEGRGDDETRQKEDPDVNSNELRLRLRIREDGSDAFRFGFFEGFDVLLNIRSY